MLSQLPVCSFVFFVRSFVCIRSASTSTSFSSCLAQSCNGDDDGVIQVS